MKITDHQHDALLAMRNTGKLVRDRAGWRANMNALWRAASGTVLALQRKGLCKITPNGTGGEAKLSAAGRRFLSRDSAKVVAARRRLRSMR